MVAALSDPIFRIPRLAANFALLSGGEMVSKLFALAAFVYLARILGPADFGILEFALAIIFFFTLLVDGGLSQYGAREIAKDKDAAARLTAHVIVMRCLYAVVAFGLLAILVMFIDKPWTVKRLILLYGLTLFALPGILSFAFQGYDLMHYVALASIIRWSIFGTSVFLLIHRPDQTWVVPVIEGAAIACVGVFYLLAFSYRFGSLRQRISYKFAFSIFSEALPMGASELVWALKVYLATVLLGLWIGGAEVGWFGAAHRIVISLHTFVWLYFFNLLPSIARCTQGPLGTLCRLEQTSIRLTAWASIFVGVIATAFAEPMIQILYGSQYHEGVAAFRVLVWLIPLALMSGHFRYALIAYGQQRLEFVSSACGAGLNILLNIFLIPSIGLVGAAWALIASEALIWGLTYSFVRYRITHIPIGIPILRPLLGGLVLAATLYLLPPISIWIAGSSAVAVYSLVLSIMQPKILTHIRALFVHKHSCNS
jgi:O-antigen/teichoic acid export membrane protein